MIKFFFLDVFFVCVLFVCVRVCVSARTRMCMRVCVCVCVCVGESFNLCMKLQIVSFCTKLH